MQNLPSAKIYELEISYMPWKKLRDTIIDYVIVHAPQKAEVLDLLCGPGYILGNIQKQRSDLICLGLDLESEYIEYAKNNYPNVSFEVADVIKWESNYKYDVILCTAGVHHLPYEYQEEFIEKIAQLSSDDGFVIIGDLYIDDFSNEQERKVSASKLGYEYLKITIENGAPNEIVKTAIDVMDNDVMGVEYKTSLKRIKPILEKYFSNIEIHKTWPNNDSEYGDYYFILKK